MKRVVFRVDASTYIGSGHVMRCLVLADELKRAGYSTEFACIPQSGDMISYIIQRGHLVIKLTPPIKYVKPEYEADYMAWLQRSVKRDVDDFLAHFDMADLVVTDHYAIDQQWQASVKKHLHCKIFAIDDLVRKHDAELILDQTLGREPAEYASQGKVLSGTQYALLVPEFSLVRERTARKKLDPESLKVLITMGGIDQPNATLKVLNVLVPSVNAAYTVVLSPRAPHYQAVVEFCNQHTNVKHEDFVRDMAGLMLDQDIAIGAPGSTSWERACLGLPGVVIPLAQNQNVIAEQLEKYNASITISLSQVDCRLLSTFQRVIERWQDFHSASLSLCDGRGVFRVASQVEQMMSSPQELKIELISATLKDISLVFEWQQRSEIRRYALNTERPIWSEHESWMKNKISSCSDYFYMIKNESREPLGVARLDRIEVEHYLISIFIAPEHFGKGIATAALALLDKVHSNISIHAQVLPDNSASQKLFERAGYERIDAKNFIRRPMPRKVT